MIRVITIPSGRRVTLGQYVEAWKRLLKMNPDDEVAPESTLAGESW